MSNKYNLSFKDALRRFEVERMQMEINEKATLDQRKRLTGLSLMSRSQLALLVDSLERENSRLRTFRRKLGTALRFLCKPHSYVVPVDATPEMYQLFKELAEGFELENYRLRWT